MGERQREPERALRLGIKASWVWCWAWVEPALQSRYIALGTLHFLVNEMFGPNEL